MKKKLLMLAMVTIGCGSYAQSNIFPASGNVGIGTNSPLALLHVAGTTQTNLISFAEGSSQIGYLGRGLSITGGLAGTPDVLALTYMKRDFAIAGWGKSDNLWKGISFYINSDNGNVGIGTTSPSAPLDIESSANSSWATQIINNGTTNAHGLYVNIGSGSTGIPFRVDVNGSDMFQVSNNGNVGIGTTSPSDKLDVNGSISLSGGAREIHFRDAANNIKQYLWLTSDNALGMGVGSASNSLFVTTGGFVGIGTTTPDAKLAVKGTIHTQEVKVDMTGWGDFVFDKTYPLPTLSSVKTYIDQNHHLPEIPSEAEVIKNGVNLGEMVKLQTKKIEELTLYLIEQQKQTEQIKQQQDARIVALEKVLSKLTHNK